MFYYYLLIISLVAVILFVFDKNAAKHQRRRIPENVLHAAELLGGVFVIIPMMYLIRHKNRKAPYFLVTYLILAAWLVALYFIFRKIPFLAH